MILALDIGNTNIVIGGIDENQIHFVSRLSTDHNKTEDEYGIVFKNIMEIYNVTPEDITGGIVSSVVPPLTSIIVDAIKKITNSTPLIVGPGVKTGLNILIDNPAQLGSDLVVNSVAAISQYKAPLIIIDMGTATTISIIDKNQNYMGSVFFPGIMISQSALSSRTSQLPYIGLDMPEKVIGTNTIEAMKSGLIYGNAGMIDGMIERIEQDLGEKTVVISTGGLSNFITPYCKKQIIYDADLLLKGLWEIYKKNVK